MGNKLTSILYVCTGAAVLGSIGYLYYFLTRIGLKMSLIVGIIMFTMFILLVSYFIGEQTIKMFLRKVRKF